MVCEYVKRLFVEDKAGDVTLEVCNIVFIIGTNIAVAENKALRSDCYRINSRVTLTRENLSDTE